MATDTRTGPRNSRKRNRRLRYFYLNDELHRVLSVNRGQDLVVTWNFPQGKRVGYVWSVVRKTYGKAFTLQEVADMLNRHKLVVFSYLKSGDIRKPQQVYTLDGKKTPGKYMFSEKDIYDIHDFFLTVHRGRPRSDGRITPGNMPSKAELRALIKHDVQTYVKTDSGEFVPVWKEIEW